MAKNDKTRFFYVLFSDKTRVFDQLERAQCAIYITKLDICMTLFVLSFVVFLDSIVASHLLISCIGNPAEF